MYNKKIIIRIKGKIMTKRSLLTMTMLTLVGLTGCTQSPAPVKYNIDKEKNIDHIERSFELYKTHQEHKAMAVAMDEEGKYVLGYSFDCATQESAKRIALENCNNANANAEVKADASCTLFALENTIVKPLR